MIIKVRIPLYLDVDVDLIDVIDEFDGNPYEPRNRKALNEIALSAADLLVTEQGLMRITRHAENINVDGVLGNILVRHTCDFQLTSDPTLVDEQKPAAAPTKRGKKKKRK